MVNSVNSPVAAYATPTSNQATAASKKAEETQTTQATNKSSKNDAGAVYEKSANQPSKTTAKKSNPAIIAQLKSDAQQRTAQLQSIVQKMMTKQGQTLGKGDSMWSFLAGGNFSVDAATRAQAQADIAEDGYWGVQQTSDRILDFAKALAGDDPDKADELLEAFKKGFKQATGSWGKQLPDISQRTYDAVVEKFDNWKNGTQTQPTAETDL